MQLAEYLETREKPASLASRLGVSTGRLSHFKTGFDRPNAEMCIAIHRETGGVVTCDELRPDLDWGAVRKKPTKRAA